MIAAHPTRGLDIGAEEYVRNTLLECRHQGMAILLISTKLEEIMSMSDRILVMVRGQIMGELNREEADVREIGMMMAGANKQ
jgi:simple sugar transport system ATP-binding protein